MKRFLTVVLMVVTAGLSSFAQSTMPAGGNDVVDLRSPSFVGGGAHITNLDDPQTATLNPAVNGLNQRITLDLSYIGLVGMSDIPTEPDRGWRGHGFNLGGVLPTRYGVFSGSLNFLHSGLQAVETGTFGTLGLSFAKDLFPDFLVGVGMNFTLGGRDAFDWGLGFDLGVLHLAGDHGFMKDLRWGASLQRMGWGYRPTDDGWSAPATFTPAIGAAFTVLENRNFNLELQSDISLPTFQNFRFNLGSTLSFRDVVKLNAGLRLDVSQLFSDAPRRSFIPSFGFSFNFKTDLKEESGFIAENGWNRSEVRPQLSFTPMANDVWAFGLGVNVPLGVIDSDPPQVTIASEDGITISPNNDGKSDDLVFPLRIEDRRFVMGYRMKITGPDGTTVREIRNKDDRPENASFRTVMSRLASVKSGIVIPDSLRWDGLTDDGAPAPDGLYSFTVEAWDDNGNLGSTAPVSVTIDTTPPEVKLQSIPAAELVFSPNGDGSKDTLKLGQSGSTEDAWNAEIRNAAGQTVRRYSWTNASPTEVVWDGKDDAGAPVPDGVYSYVVSAVDRAQNSVTASVENIIVNTERTPIHVTIESSYFSPNRDNVQDEIVFGLEIPVRTGIETWQLTIADEDGRVHRTIVETGEPPRTIAFDGKGDRGNILAEGRYTGTLKVVYRNGNAPLESSPAFTLDLTPPQVTVRADSEVFSPNGDGNKDTVTIYQETSREELWYAFITDARGQTVKSFSWRENAESVIAWDGRGDNGTMMPDGMYEYTIRATDRAGNTGSSPKVSFRLSTEETPVFLTADLDAFSPNADGVKDRVRIMPQLRVTDGISSYELSVTDAAGTTVRSFTGRGRVESVFTWDGLSNDGRRLPDGRYRAEIRILYENGNKPSARSGEFLLDTTTPKASISADLKLFSPDGDGSKDTVTFTQTVSAEEMWEGKILSAYGTVVRNYFWKGTAPTLTWDGTDEAGNLAPDGVYRYELSSADTAGNAVKTTVDEIVLDTREAKVFVTVDTTGFSPNGDGFAEKVQFTPYLNLKDGIERWELKVVHENGTVVRQFTGASTVPAQIEWDGKNGSGKTVEGGYTGVFTVTYTKGNRPAAETTAFVLDVSAPALRTSLAPVPFSPDNDGVDDELEIRLDVKDGSGIKDWSLKVLDPVGKSFREFTGKGTPGNLIWDGRSSTGELVQAAVDYPYILTATDVLGNTATSKGVIPVDVLVIRDGDKLKIRISSINFAANSPDLTTVNPQEAEKNERILSRLAEILNKYNRYKIRIEGHAVRVFWNDPVKAAQEEQNELVPLSTSRAETVKSALVRHGVDPARISTAGLGGSEPIIPHQDTENRWKNRRVEFILIR